MQNYKLLQNLWNKSYFYACFFHPRALQRNINSDRGHGLFHNWTLRHIPRLSRRVSYKIPTKSREPGIKTVNDLLSNGALRVVLWLRALIFFYIKKESRCVSFWREKSNGAVRYLKLIRSKGEQNRFFALIYRFSQLKLIRRIVSCNTSGFDKVYFI